MVWLQCKISWLNPIKPHPLRIKLLTKGALLDNQNVARLGGEVQRRHVRMVAETDVDVVTFQKTSNDTFDAAAVVVAILPTVEERLAGDEQRRLALERSPVDVAIGCKEEQGWLGVRQSSTVALELRIQPSRVQLWTWCKIIAGCLRATILDGLHSY